MKEEDLFDMNPISIDDPIDESVFIDMKEISETSSDEAKFMLADLAKVYGDEAFMKAHPDYKKRIDIELESLRLLLKMRKSDEVTHDILIKQIGMTPNNASLYMSLNRMQNSLLNIQTKLDLTVKNINNLLKNYQMEIPFEDKETGDKTDTQQVHRGSKSFIDEMNGQMEMFEEEDDDNE